MNVLACFKRERLRIDCYIRPTATGAPEARDYTSAFFTPILSNNSVNTPGSDSIVVHESADAMVAPCTTNRYWTV